jgi:kelch-like protein 21
VTGGETSDREFLATVERYDPDLDIWNVAPTLPRPRYAHCACTVGDAMYILGGIEKEEERGEHTVNSVLKFDSRTQTWSEAAPMPAERDNAGACVLGSDTYIIGGRTDDTEETSTTYRFSTETNEYMTLAPMPKAMSGHGICVMDGLICVLGGYDHCQNNYVSSVHRFDPVTN